MSHVRLGNSSTTSIVVQLNNNNNNNKNADVVESTDTSFLEKKQEEETKNSNNNNMVNLEEINRSDITFIEPLASGSYATVFLAEWKQKQVAIKHIIFNEKNTRKKCEFEQYVMEQLNDSHATNVVKFYGGMSTKTHYSIVMEYLEKGSLFDLFYSQQAPNWQETRYHFLLDMTKGLNYLHKLNFVHSDIKPDNFLVDTNDTKIQIKLCDFGLTKKEGEKNFAGTSLYAAPEVMFHIGLGNTKKSDIYSLARTFWDVASWGKPSRFTTIPEFISGKMLGMNEIIPEDFPPKVAKLIQFCWMRNPDERPSANELETELSSDIDIPLSNNFLKM